MTSDYNVTTHFSSVITYDTCFDIYALFHDTIITNGLDISRK